MRKLELRASIKNGVENKGLIFIQAVLLQFQVKLINKGKMIVHTGSNQIVLTNTSKIFCSFLQKYMSIIDIENVR